MLLFTPPYKYALQGMGFYDKFVDRFRDATFQKNPVVTKRRSSNYLELLRGNILGNLMMSHWQDLTWNFLMVWFHNILKLICHKHSLCPKITCAENWRKTHSLPTLNSRVKCAMHLFPRSKRFLTASDWTGCFELLFWFSSVILLSKMKLLFFDLSTSPDVTNLSIHYGGKYTVSKIFADKIFTSSLNAWGFWRFGRIIYQQLSRQF